MTASGEEDQRVAVAQAAGEAAAAPNAAFGETMQANIAGSQEAVEPPAQPDDISVAWFREPWTPDGVSPQPSSSPNVSDPLDNSQSQ
jgi:hypothetical protein